MLLFLAGAIEKQKLVYILNRDAAARLTISSPLEAHKANTLVYHVVGVDVGFENPMFACLEMDYEVRRTSIFLCCLLTFVPICSSSVIGEHWLLLLSEAVFIFHKLTGFLAHLQPEWASLFCLGDSFLLFNCAKICLFSWSELLLCSFQQVFWPPFCCYSKLFAHASALLLLLILFFKDTSMHSVLGSRQ